jgi:hypothetical protein
MGINFLCYVAIQTCCIDDILHHFPVSVGEALTTGMPDIVPGLDCVIPGISAID